MLRRLVHASDFLTDEKHPVEGVAQYIAFCVAVFVVLGVPTLGVIGLYSALSTVPAVGHTGAAVAVIAAGTAIAFTLLLLGPS